MEGGGFAFQSEAPAHQRTGNLDEDWTDAEYQTLPDSLYFEPDGSKGQEDVTSRRCNSGGTDTAPATPSPPASYPMPSSNEITEMLSSMHLQAKTDEDKQRRYSDRYPRFRRGVHLRNKTMHGETKYRVLLAERRKLLREEDQPVNSIASTHAHLKVLRGARTESLLRYVVVAPLEVMLPPPPLPCEVLVAAPAPIFLQSWHTSAWDVVSSSERETVVGLESLGNVPRGARRPTYLQDSIIKPSTRPLQHSSRPLPARTPTSSTLSDTSSTLLSDASLLPSDEEDEYHHDLRPAACRDGQGHRWYGVCDQDREHARGVRGSEFRPTVVFGRHDRHPDMFPGTPSRPQAVGRMKPKHLLESQRRRNQVQLVRGYFFSGDNANTDLPPVEVVKRAFSQVTRETMVQVIRQFNVELLNTIASRGGRRSLLDAFWTIHRHQLKAIVEDDDDDDDNNNRHHHTIAAIERIHRAPLLEIMDYVEDAEILEALVRVKLDMLDEAMERKDVDALFDIAYTFHEERVRFEAEAEAAHYEHQELPKTKQQRLEDCMQSSFHAFTRLLAHDKDRLVDHILGFLAANSLQVDEDKHRFPRAEAVRQCLDQEMNFEHFCRFLRVNCRLHFDQLELLDDIGNLALCEPGANIADAYFKAKQSAHALRKQMRFPYPENSNGLLHEEIDGIAVAVARTRRKLHRTTEEVRRLQLFERERSVFSPYATRILEDLRHVQELHAALVETQAELDRERARSQRDILDDTIRGLRAQLDHLQAANDDKDQTIAAQSRTLRTYEQAMSGGCGPDDDDNADEHLRRRVLLLGLQRSNDAAEYIDELTAENETLRRLLLDAEASVAERRERVRELEDANRFVMTGRAVGTFDLLASKTGYLRCLTDSSSLSSSSSFTVKRGGAETFVVASPRTSSSFSPFISR